MMDDTLETHSQILQRLTLDLRSTRFVIERETLMNLPESVLLCLFPNGLVLSRQHQFGIDGEDDDEEEEEEVYVVDFDPHCLSFVLSFFKKAQEDFYGTPTTPGLYNPEAAQIAAGHHHTQSSADFDMTPLGGAPSLGGNPLLVKQAIIVLREELEYFAIPPKAASKGADDPEAKAVAATDERGQANPALLDLKRACGAALLGRKQIFTALQRNVNKENNVAEQHLIDMLCMSGFDRGDLWGYRALEPSRCCITSIALVLLKTGITHAGAAATSATGAANRPEDGGKTAGADAEGGAEEETQQLAEGETSIGGMKINQHQLATAQKLLLFWRKPARKCWWDGVDVVIPTSSAAESVPAGRATAADTAGTTTGMTEEEVALLESGRGQKVRVWARRVWTLELSLI